MQNEKNSIIKTLLNEKGDEEKKKAISQLYWYRKDQEKLRQEQSHYIQGVPELEIPVRL